MEKREEYIKLEKSYLKSSRVIEVVLVATLAALSISASYLLAPLVNIELMSFIIFISGYLFGIIIGAGVGVISSLIYYGWNPYGPSNPLIFIACVICMVLFGIVGGIIKPKLNKNNNNSKNGKLKYSMWNIYKFSLNGLLITLTFDIITNLISGFVFYGGNFIAAIVLGIPFLLIHTISNTIVFASLSIPLYNSINIRLS